MNIILYVKQFLEPFLKYPWKPKNVIENRWNILFFENFVFARIPFSYVCTNVH